MFETKELGKFEEYVWAEVETCELDQVADDNHVEYIEEEMMKVENNISGNHIEGGRLRCKICRKVSSSKSKFARHNLLHTEVKPFSCNLCGNQYSRNDSLKRHIEKHKECSERKFPDVGYLSEYIIEPKKATARNNMKKHIESVHETIFRVKMTEETVSPDTNILDQTEIFTFENESNSNTSNCVIKNEPGALEEENYMEKSNNSIIVPKMESEETEINTANDEIHGDTFVKENRLEQNMLEIHVNGSKVSCEVCRKVLPSKSKLASHNLVHTGEKSFSCEICGNKYARIQSLKQHIETHQEGFIKTKRHNCTTCDKKFDKLSKLKRHEFTHTGGNDNFPCEVCGHLLSSRPRLLAHKMIHTGEKPYSCEQCGNGYRNNDNLNQHLKTHQEGFKNPKPHQCFACGKHFDKYSRLHEHEFKHNHPGVKPYQCLVCQVVFTYSESLKKHMKKKHNEKFV